MKHFVKSWNAVSGRPSIWNDRFQANWKAATTDCLWPKQPLGWAQDQFRQSCARTRFDPTYILLRYSPPTSNSAFVICPSEHTRTVFTNSAKTLPFSITVRFNRSSAFGATFALRA
jgi:hypothetical protein